MREARGGGERSLLMQPDVAELTKLSLLPALACLDVLVVSLALVMLAC